MANKWTLLEELKDNRGTLTDCVEPERDLHLKAAYDYTLSELSDLEKVRCSTCSGFAHTMEMCPTQHKLDNLTHVGGAHADVLAWGQAMFLHGPALFLFGDHSSSTIKFGSPGASSSDSELSSHGSMS